MAVTVLDGFGKPRLKALLDHFAAIEDPCEPRRVAHALPDVLLLVVCGTICDCDDFDAIADWGKAMSISCVAICPITTGPQAGAG